jgi:hypothetical protein
MDFDVDNIISTLREYTHKPQSVELGEQEGEPAADEPSTPAPAAPASAPSAPSSGGGGGGGTTTQAKEKNVKKWESGRKMGKTYGGHGYVWSSDRAMGKTYGGPGYVWQSGASRGKANPTT